MIFFVPQKERFWAFCPPSRTQAASLGCWWCEIRCETRIEWTNFCKN